MKTTKLAKAKLLEPGRCLRLGIALALFLSGLAHPANAFTQRETREIFDTLDTDHDGKVTELEFRLNKYKALFSRHRAKNKRVIRLTFEETGLSQDFFDKADHGHKGYLDASDVSHAIRFEDIDTTQRGYFDYPELVAYLRRIGR